MSPPLNPKFDAFTPRADGPPRHVGIIPDGGRRWARIHGCSLHESYRVSTSKLLTFCGHLYARGVSTISIYGSSSQNFARSPDEVRAFCEVTAEFCGTLAGDFAREYQTRIRGVGVRRMLPDYLREAVERTEAATADYSATELNILLAHSPFEEIADALRLAPTPEDWLDHLWIKTPANVIIRTGGANLLSNFLLLQAGFAHIYFLNALMNDIGVSDLDSALSSYAGIERVYGP